MKRNCAFAVIMVMVLALMLTGCGKSEFTMTENTGKLMSIKAENAGRDDFFMVGSLEVADGEQIVITSELAKGTIRVEIIGTPEEQSIDELPDTDGEPTITANAHGSDQVSGTVPAGSYMLKATCLEKATGTVRIEVLPFTEHAADVAGAD